MDKQQALEELKQLKARADALEAIINAPEVPESIHGILLKGGDVVHWYISTAGIPTRGLSTRNNEEKYGLAFVSEEALKKHMKQMELHQRCRVAMAKDWGNVKVTWGADTIRKYVLKPTSSNHLSTDYFYGTYSPFYFRTQRAANDFIDSLTVEEQLLFIMGADA